MPSGAPTEAAAHARHDRRISFRNPTVDDGLRVWELIAACPPLDQNSIYCNCLQCSHFADTCMLAERDGQAVGWVSGYRPPAKPDTLFIWQIAVHPDARGEGLGKQLIETLLRSDACAGVYRIETTITAANDLSWALFTATAQSLGAPLRRQPWFDRDDHFDGRHDTEHLVRIGPFDTPAQRDAHPPPHPWPPRRAQRTLREQRQGDPMSFACDQLESEVRSYSRSFPVMFDRACGARLFDRAGNAYLDFLAGCSTLNYGHNHPVLKQALLDYVANDGVTHGLDLYTVAKSDFLQEFQATVLEPRNLDYVVQFPGPTGANAVEAALKLARKVTGRTNVIAFTNGFHGVTLGALACTGNDHHRGGAGIPLGGTTRMPYEGYLGAAVDTAGYLDRILSDPSSGVDAPAAVIVETVQGEGGLHAASIEWLRRVAAVARRHGALFVVDDIQAGVGRTGTFFSFEPAGLRPDIVTLAKSLSGYGLPMALVLIRRDLDAWKPGEHNGTFRGNCHAFVTARAALETFWRDDGLQQAVQRKGQILGERLAAIADRYGPQAAATRGRGMMRGLDLKSGAIAGRIVSEAFERGLVIETSGARDEVVKCLAPLTIDEADLLEGLDIIEAAVAATMADAAKAAA